MNTLFKFRLYTTSHCHLCDMSKDMLFSIIEKDWVEVIDIADHSLLIETYGSLIPVLQNLMTLQELKWPFTISEIMQFTKL